MFEDRNIVPTNYKACQSCCKRIPDKQKVVLKVQDAIGKRSKFEMLVNNKLLKFVTFFRKSFCMK